MVTGDRTGSVRGVFWTGLREFRRPEEDNSLSDDRARSIGINVTDYYRCVIRNQAWQVRQGRYLLAFSRSR